MTAARQRWRRIRRIAFYVFLALVAFLLVRYARSVDWAEVGKTLAGYGPGTLAMAVGITLASYLLYSAYDLAGRRYARHTLPAPRVMGIAMVAYAFSLNVGALFGGAGFRYRLYAHAGLGLGTISRVVAFAIGTNWMGYLLLAGALFASGRVTPPPSWPVTGERLPWVGAAMLVAVVVYLIACHVTHGRVFHVRGHHFRLPSLPLALVQLGLASTNWALMAGLLFVLMPKGVAYADVLGPLLVAAVASAIAHIPAGIGVLEAVFIALLGHQVPQPQMLAALLAYRACYYLGPLLVAIAGYAALESRRRAHPPSADEAARAPDPPREHAN
ncbi:lysylphosphatidylglycerol synthase domain-containing protein [Lysobacter auxotrophicus]|uniref:Lysylphosphatidylglycerol synthase domain-containing protein n=1 Tax=Lysobacter auxotrophicus TaxID=2992573 RepID=A0ABM8DIM7_9GAMM|nr:lysylphosphatidylglycerol synthase domain-containing protein [Lysobacter auxotrophicus]BDU18439.1 lysylphosphatidylglycerol synthase domain-containing protein [Lysobacter auxotrophicus]